MAYKNSEGYPDPTAGKAIANTQTCLPGHVYLSYTQSAPIVVIRPGKFVSVGYRIESFLPYDNDDLINVSSVVEGVIDPWRIINMSNTKLDEHKGQMSDEEFMSVLKGFVNVCQVEVRTVVDDRAREIEALENNVADLTESVNKYQQLYETEKAEAEKLRGSVSELKAAPGVVDADALVRAETERDVYQDLFMQILQAVLKPQA